MQVRTLSQLPADVAEAIKRGDNKTLCPICNGGRSSELSLGVYHIRSNDIDLDSLHTVKLTCWRASCGWACMILAGGNVELHRSPIKQGTPYTGVAYNLLYSTQAELGNKYGLQAKVYSHRWKQTDNADEIVFEIHGVACELRGHVVRNMKTKRIRAFKQTAKPWVDYWLINPSRPMVIVEDSISAARLYQCGYNAVALQGTRLTPAAAQEIRSYKCPAYYIALDRDATGKAMQYVTKYSYMFRPLHLVCLWQDIKNMRTDAEIRELFDEDYSDK